MRTAVLLLLLLACAACSSPHDLTSCRGRFVAANAGMWAPTQADLVAP